MTKCYNTRPDPILTHSHPTVNTPGTVGGRVYSGHAFDRMQQRGIYPSAVEEAIGNGTVTQGRNGAMIYTDTTNGIEAIVNGATGRVVTVKPVGKGCE